MSEPFVGQLKMFAGNFAPRGFAFCDGQLLRVSQNQALFSLLGTIYGGDGRTTFGLPDLRGRIPIHQGSGPGLTPRQIGSKGGGETETVTEGQLPPHVHILQSNTQAGQEGNPNNAVPAQATVFVYDRNPLATGLRSLAANSITSVGGSQPHTNLQPFLCIHFIIALFGVFPSRR